MAFIQVGIIAYRKPNGEFLPAKPIYEEIPDDQLTKSKTTKQDELACNEIAKLLAHKYKQYVDGCRAEKIRIKNDNKKRGEITCRN